MKFTKELKIGLIAIAGILVLVTGINFMKGNSLFGGDATYFSYFSNSGQLVVSNNVTLYGVVVGKVKKIEYEAKNTINRRVKVTFSITNDDVFLPKGTIIEIGSLDLFSKGILIQLSANIAKDNYQPGQEIPGRVNIDMLSQVKAYADPISQKLQGMMASIDKMVISLSSFWDTTATSEIEGSLKQVKITIQKLGNVAVEIEGFVIAEKIQFARIMSNVESITLNLQKSNDQITAILGNTKKITDDFVTADFKSVILDAQTTLKKLNIVLDDAGKGNGTLGKLIHDEKLYNELVETNNELQILVSDIQVHPERYIHFSIAGRKSKGVPLNSKDEKKLRMLLDSISE